MLGGKRVDGEGRGGGGGWGGVKGGGGLWWGGGGCKVVYMYLHIPDI